MKNCRQSQLLINQDLYNQLNPQKYNPENLEQKYTSELKIKLYNAHQKSDRQSWLYCFWEIIKWNDRPGIMITATNVTKYKQAEAKTHQALTAEKEICKNKAKFVSMVSHEFRTPLNIISFSTSLLKRHLHKWTGTKQLKYLDRL